MEFPAVIEVVVEIPSGSRNKYEYSEQSEVIWLDRVLSSAVFYNFDYGYIEQTRRMKGTAITPTTGAAGRTNLPRLPPGARPIGGLRMDDEKGDDFKVCAWHWATRCGRR